MAADFIETWREERLTHWLTADWAEALAEVVRALDFSGQAVDFHFQPRLAESEVGVGWEDPVWLRIELRFPEPLAVELGCDRSTGRALAALIVGDEGLDEETAGSTYREILNQAASSFSATLSGRLDQSIEAGHGEPIAGPEATELAVELVFHYRQDEYVVALSPTAALLRRALRDFARVEAADFPEAEAPPESGAIRSANGNAAASALSLSPESQANLEMLLEVDMEISVSFGQTRMPLEDVLKLGSGSIVELNRGVADPIDVLVNDYVIARGEVVVVDGNYGVRITEVVSRKDRIQSLF